MIWGWRRSSDPVRKISANTSGSTSKISYHSSTVLDLTTVSIFSQYASRLSMSSVEWASFHSGSVSIQSRPSTRINPVHNRSDVWENCIHRPSLDSATNSRNDNHPLGTRRVSLTRG